jgi:hypothetical protein
MERTRWMLAIERGTFLVRSICVVVHSEKCRVTTKRPCILQGRLNIGGAEGSFVTLRLPVLPSASRAP